MEQECDTAAAFFSPIFVKCKFSVIECKEKAGFVEARKPATMQEAAADNVVRMCDGKPCTQMDTTASLQPAHTFFFCKEPYYPPTSLFFFSCARIHRPCHSCKSLPPSSHSLVPRQSLLPHFGLGEACLIMQVCTIVLGKGAAFPLSL